ncbi:MAG: dTDP-4-amino-4,6-dideoxygalactose transaminase [Desulfobacteraceae bacterium 4484_190.1]|nr:MAG: dTDP-4-amino-4,6-dideoxygalactose transaminase [Desulfobacteraceae bacterium 4484_190.1]
MKIPFNRPFIIGKELYYISQSVISGHTAGDGVFTKKCHELIKEKLGARMVLLTTSCTAALEMSAILCNISPGDEVILPSFTFVSTVNAFYMRGARPVFVDIRPDTLNLDETKVEEAITEKTKVIVPVHYGGVGCDMDVIMDIANRHGLLVVEDAAHALNSEYKEQYLGTIGDIGAFSFHETKNYICGEGGAIILNNEDFIERAEIVREKGTDRSKFFRGEVDKYTWVDLGSSYLPSDILAAFLYAQLENMDEIDIRRRGIFDYYLKTLSPLAEKGVLKLPVIPPECRSCGHLFYIILKDEEIRNGLMNYLKSRGIGAVFHYLPLHLSTVGSSLGGKDGQLPVTESVSGRLLRLPLFYELKEDEQDYIVESIRSFFDRGLQ